MKLPVLDRISKKVDSQAVFIVILLIIVLLAVAFNLLVIPLLITVVLGAFGVQVSYWVALAGWILFLFIINIVRNK